MAQPNGQERRRTFTRVTELYPPQPGTVPRRGRASLQRPVAAPERIVGARPCRSRGWGAWRATLCHPAPILCAPPFAPHPTAEPGQGLALATPLGSSWWGSCPLLRWFRVQHVDAYLRQYHQYLCLQSWSVRAALYSSETGGIPPAAPLGTDRAGTEPRAKENTCNKLVRRQGKAWKA